MIYRENGQFKTRYATDQQVFPIAQDRIAIGLLLANFLYLGTLILIAYSCVLIACGRYPKIPVLSEAARLQVQRGYSD